MQIGDMRLVDVLEIVEDFKGGRREAPTIDHGMAVVVLDRGFVYVGRTVTSENWCTIEDAHNIRYWGTTKGLAELIQGGPTPNTRLDATGDLRAPMRAVISIHPTREELWKRS